MIRIELLENTDLVTINVSVKSLNQNLANITAIAMMG